MIKCSDNLRPMNVELCKTTEEGRDPVRRG